MTTLNQAAKALNQRPLRRAEDHEEARIRQIAWDCYTQALVGGMTPWDAVMAALDSYKRELMVLAVKRMGVRV